VRSVAIAICGLTLTTTLWSSVKVEPLVPQECSNHLQVSVVLDGKAVSGAKLDFYSGFNVDTTRTRPILSVSTNNRGRVVPFSLSPGNYTVFASFEGVRSAIFNQPARTILYVHMHPKSATRTISVDLAKAVQAVRQADADFEQQLDKSEEFATPDRVDTFRGIVFDPSRAHVPSVKVSIMRRVSGLWTTWVRTTSDGNGQFSAELADGRYVGVFSSPGFRIAVVPFEVTKAGSADLKVMLQIGAAAE
jgi:hypothetical protein